MGMGHVAVHILDLRQVLLGHVYQLGGAHLVGEPWEPLVKRRGVIFLVVVLLRVEREKETRADRGRKRETWTKKTDEIQMLVKKGLCYFSQT